MVTTSSAALAKYAPRRLAEESPRRRRSESRPWGPSFKDDSAEVRIFSREGSVPKDGSVLGDESPPFPSSAEMRSGALALVGRFGCMREGSDFMNAAPETTLVTHSIEPFVARRSTGLDSGHFLKRRNTFAICLSRCRRSAAAPLSFPQPVAASRYQPASISRMRW